MNLDAPRRTSTREAHVRAVTRVIRSMRERLDANITLGEMAGEAYMSRYHFDRTFRDVTGVRPRQYLRALRLQAARRLLVHTTSSVTEVCFDVGYNSLGTFIRCFTDLLGISPRRLRLLAGKADGSLPAAVAAAADEPLDARGVAGTVSAPDDFKGAIFIGLFPTAIPQGVPRACAVVLNTGRYRINPVPDGDYYLFALGVPWSTSARDIILCESALRAGGDEIGVRGGVGSADMNLRLREPSPLDPPLLVTLPALLTRRAFGRSPGIPTETASAGTRRGGQAGGAIWTTAQSRNVSPRTGPGRPR
jgi:AraC family transcriptional regulator